MRERLVTRFRCTLGQPEETIGAAHRTSLQQRRLCGYQLHVRGGPSGTCAETRAVEQRVAHHPVSAMDSVGDLAAA